MTDMLFTLANRLGKPNITSPIQMLMGDVLLVNNDRLIFLTIVTFICLAVIPIYGPSALAQAAAPKLVADRPVLPLWNVGGNVKLTVSQIPVNVTYYVWVQRPSDLSSRYTGFQFINSGKTVTIPIQVTVSATDPAGTYTVSLSTSTFSDTTTAIAHFGVYGTDSSAYQRTNKMEIAGGGFVPNSKISINVQAGAQALSGFPTNVTAGSRGDFAYNYSVPPSAPVAAVTVSASGPAYDSHNSTAVSGAATIQPTTLALKILRQPTASVERTSNAIMLYSITYPDNSSVTTSTPNSTRVFVVSDAGPVIAEVALSLSDAKTGQWQAIWVPPRSTNLASYHFEISPRDFDDSFGNLGTGNTLASQSFGITPAKVQLVLQGNTTIQRTQDAHLVLTAQYHNGVQFTNVTQATGVITEPDGTTHPIAFNSTLNEFIGRYNTTVSSRLGQVLVSAALTDLFGNTASGTLTIQVVKAATNFAVNIPTSVERTTVLNVSARITYPDGSVLTPDLVPSGFNLTISRGNFTWTGTMNFNLTTSAWSNGYPIAQNATLGDYSVKIGVLDQYGNGGNYSTSSTIVRARFRFYLPLASERASPGTYLNVLVLVKYPNGSLLAPRVNGTVTASFTNSTGTFTLPLIFNATDRTWHIFFVVPDPGLRLGLTITFSLTADDAFGNSGLASKAFELDVGAGAQTLMLASIIGAIPVIALLGWAIATVSARRRKYKP
jgi:hypothetical protein